VSVTIVIVDDHAVVRTGLRLLLDAEEDFETVAEAGTAREAVFEARKHKPDVILMDVGLPDRSGIEATGEVLKEAPKAKVLVLSMEDDPRYVREAFAAGASGYVLKEAADAELVTALRQVAAGERYVHPALGARMAAAEAEAAARPHEPGDRPDALHLRPHGRDAPGPHHAEAAPQHPRRTRALRPRPGSPRGVSRPRRAGRTRGRRARRGTG
jgi:DNA-binding NarL/FixJ family response regulator